jgi:serine/threonine-protein kinase
VTWLLAGYDEIRELGSGAAGRVVLAVHQASGSPVAIKYLSLDSEHLAEFRGEAAVLAELDSPHIARIYEYVEAAEGAAIVMELVNGPALSAILREGGPVSPEAALAVLSGSLAGLSKTHAVGVVHRDYKPGNVIVDGNGASKLVDFGIATRAGAAMEVSGTPSYMAPEQWTGGPATPATDIYAATATFVECLTGRPPYAGPTSEAIRLAHANAPIPTDGVAAPLRDLVRRGLAKDPGDRPPDAAAFLAELQQTAQDAYGSDWEKRGRGHLGRRAAMLALLIPLGGSGTTTALAKTILGPALAAAIALALVIGGGTAVNAGRNGPTDIGAPTAYASWPPGEATPPQPTGTAPAPAPGGPPTAGPTAIALTTGGAATNTSSQPPPPPPPPATSVTKLSITSFAYDNGGVGPTATASTSVATSGTGTVVLTLVYKSSTVGAPIRMRTANLSGSTSYVISDSVDPSAWCGGTVTITASTSPTAANGAPSKSVPGIPC